MSCDSFRKIYWTSTALMGIYVSTMEGQYVSPLFAGTSSHARGIAVDPNSRYEFSTGQYLLVRYLNSNKQFKNIKTNDLVNEMNE